MNLLLDTHAYLWFVGGRSSLSRAARALIEDTSHQQFVSIASLWEIAIKTSLGKLELPCGLDELFDDQLTRNGFTRLAIEPWHLKQVAILAPHHGDPFDRLLVAQCQTEDYVLISRDSGFDAYGITRRW